MQSSNAPALRFCAALALFFLALSVSHAPQWLHSPATLLGLPMLAVCAGFSFAPQFLGSARRLAGLGLRHLYLPAVGWGLLFVLLHSLNVWLHLTAEPAYGLRGSLWHALNVVFVMDGFDNPLGTMLPPVRMMLVGGLLLVVLLRIVRHLFPTGTRRQMAWTAFAVSAGLYLVQNTFRLTIESLPQGGALEMLAAAMMASGVVLRQYEAKLTRLYLMLCGGMLVVLCLCAFAPIQLSYHAGLLSAPVLVAGGVAAFLFAFSGARLLEDADYLPEAFPAFTLRHAAALLALTPLAMKPVSLIAAGACGLPAADALRGLVVAGAPAWCAPLYALCGFGLPLGAIALCGWLERRYTVTAVVRSWFTIENLARATAVAASYCIVGIRAAARYSVVGARAAARYSVVGARAAWRGVRWSACALWRGLKALGRGLWRTILGIGEAAKDIVSASSPKDE